MLLDFCILQWKKIPKPVIEEFVLLLSPFAPHIAEELWSRLGHTSSLAYESFPEVWISFIPLRNSCSSDCTISLPLISFLCIFLDCDHYVSFST